MDFCTKGDADIAPVIEALTVILKKNMVRDPSTIISLTSVKEQLEALQHEEKSPVTNQETSSSFFTPPQEKSKHKSVKIHLRRSSKIRQQQDPTKTPPPERNGEWGIIGPSRRPKGI